MAKPKLKHITTIAGPQAEALLRLWKPATSWEFRDKSVSGLAIVEIYGDV